MSIDVGEIVLRLRADIKQLVAGLTQGKQEVRAAGVALETEGTRVNAAIRQSLEQMSPVQRQRVKELVETSLAARKTRISEEELSAATKEFDSKVGGGTAAFAKLRAELALVRADFAAGIVQERDYAATLADIRRQAVAMRESGIAPTGKELAAFSQIMGATAQKAEQTGHAAGFSSRNLYYLTRTMGTVSAESVGLNSRMGYLIKDLLLLGGGGGVMLGVLGATTLLGLGYRALTKHTQEAKQATDDLIASLEKERAERTGSEAVQQRAAIVERLASAQKDLARAQGAATLAAYTGRGPAIGTGGTPAIFARAAAATQVDVLQRRLNALKQDLADFDAKQPGVKWIGEFRQRAADLARKTSEIGASARTVFMDQARDAGITGQALAALMPYYDRWAAATARQKRLEDDLKASEAAVEAARRGVTQTLQERQRAADQLIASLTRERDVVGMTQDQLRGYDIAHTDLFPGERGQADLLARQIAFKERAKSYFDTWVKVSEAMDPFKPVARHAKQATDTLTRELEAGGEAAGRALIEGLIYGTTGLSQTLGRIIVNLAEDKIIGTLKDKLGIHSPSAVTRDLGRNTMQGFALGLQDVGASLRSDLTRYTTLGGGTLPGVRLAARAGAGDGTTVHQELHFHVSAIDQRGVAAFFDANGGHIANQVARAARGSAAFRAVIARGR